MEDGYALGEGVGTTDGNELGAELGIAVGKADGIEVGVEEGKIVGIVDGNEVGVDVGRIVGEVDGIEVGREDGMDEGSADGRADGDVGAKLGVRVATSRDNESEITLTVWFKLDDSEATKAELPSVVANTEVTFAAKGPELVVVDEIENET
jgi:hypothetical protein